jgi:hypothetical protein
MPAKDYYYYIDTTGYCSNGNFQLNTVGKPNYAKICAWKPSLPNVVYGCNAKGGICWTSPQDCALPHDIGNSSLGYGLQSCTRPSGSKWCCRDGPVERCGITPTEAFICWANDLDDDNPMRRIENEVAKNPESARSILSSMSLTISSPTALPIITTAFLTSSANNISMTPKSPQHPEPILSTSAIVGVAIGALVVLGSLILVVAFLLRHKRRRRTRVELHNTKFETLVGQTSANELSDTMAKYEVGGSECAELSGPRSDQRHELPT